MSRIANQSFSPSEDRIQADIMQHFHNTRPETRKCIWHVPNGGSKNESEGNRFKAMGVVPGIQDIHVFWNGKFYAIELKTQTGTISNEQKEAHARHSLHGLMTFVVRDTQTGIELITAILDGLPLSSYQHLISPFADPEKAEQYINECKEYRARMRMSKSRR